MHTLATNNLLQFFGDAFLAGLGTSAGLTILIAFAFCVIRPYNNVVYAPRAKHADSKHAPPVIPKGLFGWIPPLARTKEADLVEKVGMDAAIFMRFVRMLRNMFAVISLVGCGVLIPLYVFAANGSSKGAYWYLRATPQYMYGSQAFWGVIAVAYAFNGIIYFFLWTNYRAVLRLRRAYFDSPDYQRSLHARTLLLTDIPAQMRTDDGIVRITEEVKAEVDEVPRAAIARNVKELPELVEEHEETVRALEQVLAKYLKDPNKLPAKRPTCKASKKDKSYSKGQKVDAIEYLTTRIKELELEIKEVRESVDKRNALQYGFASYEKIADAHSVGYVARKKGPQGTTIRLAPKPSDLVWKNLSMTKKERNWQNFINNLWVALLTLAYVVPNVLMAVFLSNLSHLGLVWRGFNDSLQAHRQWWAIFQGVISPLITNIFYYFLPAIFRRLCVKGGDLTKTSRERHVMHKLYSFFVINNLIVFSLFSTVFGYVSAVVSTAGEGKTAWESIESQHPFQNIVSALIQVSPYWASWLLQRNLGAAVDLSQVVTLVWGSFSRRYLAPTPRELIELTAPQPFEYAGYYNYFLFYATIGLCFGVLQPLVLPICAFYFWLDSFMKKYLLLYVFITKYESGGMFWRTLFNRVLICTTLGNAVVALLVVAQGIVIVNGNYGAGNWGMLAACAPLPILTLGFKLYCMRAFDEAIHYYQKGKVHHDAETANGLPEHKKRKGDRVGVRFGHPVLYKPLMTPMVSAKSQHLLKTLYSGRTSVEEQSTAGGYSDVYMDALDTNRPGKPLTSNNSPFEIVDENAMDFEHYKHRPEFRDEAGGDGQLFGRAEDMIRPGTPGMMTRTGTMQTMDTMESRERSESRHQHERSRSASRDSDRTHANETGGGVTYPRGYHQTPVLREHSPAGSEWSVPDRGRREPDTEQSRERLVDGAARMGRSPPPRDAAAMRGFATTAETPGSTPGEEATSYDYFRRGRGA